MFPKIVHFKNSWASYCAKEKIATATILIPIVSTFQKMYHVWGFSSKKDVRNVRIGLGVKRLSNKIECAWIMYTIAQQRHLHHECKPETFSELTLNLHSVRCRHTGQWPSSPTQIHNSNTSLISEAHHVFVSCIQIWKLPPTLHCMHLGLPMELLKRKDPAVEQKKFSWMEFISDSEIETSASPINHLLGVTQTKLVF